MHFVQVWLLGADFVWLFTGSKHTVGITSKQNDPLPTFILGDGLFCTGRVPSFITRFSGLTYTMGFFMAFSSGAGSYQKTCIRKLMALEHSVIADTYRKAIEKKYAKKALTLSPTHTPLSAPPYPVPH